MEGFTTIGTALFIISVFGYILTLLSITVILQKRTVEYFRKRELELQATEMILWKNIQQRTKDIRDFTEGLLSSKNEEVQSRARMIMRIAEEEDWAIRPHELEKTIKTITLKNKRKVD